MKNKQKKVVILCMACMFVILCSACGKKEEVQQPVDVNEEVTVEESEEIQQPAEETVVVEESTEEATVEEEQVEDSTANLSNEEWVKSLNLQTGTFLIFNDTTGERKVLEDGQEYTLLEGDELAFWNPVGWITYNIRTNASYEMKKEYKCRIIHIDDSEIGEKLEFTIDVEDSEGNDHSFTVYLSK